ncbi:MAG TPA: Hsp20 family protein [Methylocystis sp.]|nr:Hsp20 family protein [Methylocystis sp.]
MRAYDLSPLFRQTVGFDRLFNSLAQGGGFEAAPNYPPYNIERTAENAYRVTLAVAGFSREDLSIETRENALTIRGAQDQKEGETPRDFLHQGIAARAFERRFQLAEHVVVTGATLENGLLHVDLVREIPEAQKPRKIEIGAPQAGKPATTRIVEAKAA